MELFSLENGEMFSYQQEDEKEDNLGIGKSVPTL